MRPDDANVAGNVHGGTILKMIEEAGVIISTRHCNSQNGERCVAALARVERTDFLSPMCIGEVAHVSAEITYTSKHSVEVQVHVMSENILTGNSPGASLATLTQRRCSALFVMGTTHEPQPTRGRACVQLRSQSGHLG